MAPANTDPSASQPGIPGAVPQSHLQGGVCVGITPPGMSPGHWESCELTESAEPRALLTHKLSAVAVAGTVNELLKKQIRPGCLARAAGFVWCFCRENRLMCTVEKKKGTFLIRLHSTHPSPLPVLVKELVSLYGGSKV